ncbi:hypothetical protein STEG23_006415 [Scotinomys teguina]
MTCSTTPLLHLLCGNSTPTSGGTGQLCPGTWFGPGSLPEVSTAVLPCSPPGDELSLPWAGKMTFADDLNLIPSILYLILELLCTRAYANWQWEQTPACQTHLQCPRSCGTSCQREDRFWEVDVVLRIQKATC